uniref:Lanthionine n=1 Tax=Siphoviridae sp. ctEIp38 TaxID=2825394 RepID=A0A8S5QDI0_9CAUD|nr:MAG TPA: lanthionine [Siphoviridae sp. ctEIp38]
MSGTCGCTHSRRFGLESVPECHSGTPTTGRLKA